MAEANPTDPTSDQEAKSSNDETTQTLEGLDRLRDKVNELMRLVNNTLQTKSEGHTRRMAVIQAIMTLDVVITRLTDDLDKSVGMSNKITILQLNQAQEHKQLLKRELDLLYPH